MTAFLADVGGLTRCLVTRLSATTALLYVRHGLPAGALANLVFAGDDGTEITARVQAIIGRITGPGLQVVRILAWETDEDAPLLLVARERMVH